MNKFSKIILIFVIFIVKMAFANSVDAECNTAGKGGGKGFCSTGTRCTNSSGAVVCCDDASECASLLPGIGEPPKVDPTCNGGSGVATAIGCIAIEDTNSFVGSLFKWAVGIAGGISFLLILYASFIIMSSSGNPDRLKDGQEMITAVVSGLILLVLSVFILDFIGVDILGLDQFGFGK